MDLPALYDDDVYAWALHQADALRRLQASGLPLPNDLDLPHVAEEIEDLGNEQRFQVEGNLARALEHLLKIVLLPDDPAVPHWLGETAAFLDTAERRYRPSMRRTVELERQWKRACQRVRLEYGEATGRHMPDACPFTVEELLAVNADPRPLVTRLAAAIAPP